MASNICVPDCCLICYAKLADSELKNRNEDQDVNAIFALKVLIQIPDHLLETFIQETCTSPGCWISLCTGCTETVTRTKLMYQDIWELHKTFRSAKEGLLEKLRSSCYSGGGDNDLNRGSWEGEVNGGCRSADVGDEMKITNKCRRLVNDRRFLRVEGPEKEPFIVEDFCALTQRLMERTPSNKNDMCTGNFKEEVESSSDAGSTGKEIPMMDTFLFGDNHNVNYSESEPKVAPVRGDQGTEGASTSKDQIQELSVSFQQRLKLRHLKTKPKAKVGNRTKEGFKTKFNQECRCHRLRHGTEEKEMYEDGCIIVAGETKKAKCDERKSFHECGICHMIFTSRGDLSVHVVTCHLDKQFEHWRAEGRRPAERHLCGKRFRHQSDMNRHVLYQTIRGENSQWFEIGQSGMEQCFECPYCGKRFHEKSQFREHQKTHSNEEANLKRVGSDLQISRIVDTMKEMHMKENHF